MAFPTALHAFTIENGLSGSTVAFSGTVASLEVGITTLQLSLMDSSSFIVIQTGTMRNCRIESVTTTVTIVGTIGNFASEDIVFRTTAPATNITFSCQVSLVPSSTLTDSHTMAVMTDFNNVSIVTASPTFNIFGAP